MPRGCAQELLNGPTAAAAAGVCLACRSEGLLEDSPRPLTAELSLGRLQIDETRSKAVRRQSGRHNLSSMAGPGAIMTSEVRGATVPNALHGRWAGVDQCGCCCNSLP